MEETLQLNSLSHSASHDKHVENMSQETGDNKNMLIWCKKSFNTYSIFLTLLPCLYIFPLRKILCSYKLYVLMWLSQKMLNLSWQKTKRGSFI